MQIDVTVANEAQLLQLFREQLRAIARGMVADDPNRVGKRFARVWLPDNIDMYPVYASNERPKIEFI